MNRKGSVEVICGSMFSGKSEELIRRVKRAQIAKQKVQIFKPAIDHRFGVNKITSHNGLMETALPVDHPHDILDSLESDTQVVAIDEAQFFVNDIVDVCDSLANQGYRVIVAGLDMDFRGEPFGPIPAIMSIAESVEKLRAICVVCGKEASRSQRIIDGKPATYDSPTVLLGASEKYEARCRTCHETPRKNPLNYHTKELPLNYN